MKYLLMIYTDEKLEMKKTQAEQEKLIGEYMAFEQDIAQNGKKVAGEALQPTQTATTVRVRNGKRLTTDGPFAETKEQLGGFYLVDCKDIDEAIAWAGKIPSAKEGSIEVRPIMVFE